MRILARREAVAVDADARARGEFGADAAVSQRHGIIAGARLLGLMVEPLAIARTGFGGIARIELDAIDGTDLRHDENVAEVRMAGAREVRVTEPLDRRIVVAVTRGMIVAVANLAGRVGVGRQLDHRTEEHTSELQSLMSISYSGFCLNK